MCRRNKFSEGSIAMGSVIVRNLGDKELIFVYTDSCAVLLGCTWVVPFLGTEPRSHLLFILVCTVGQWLWLGLSVDISRAGNFTFFQGWQFWFCSLQANWRCRRGHSHWSKERNKVSSHNAFPYWFWVYLRILCPATLLFRQKLLSLSLIRVQG